MTMEPRRPPSLYLLALVFAAVALTVLVVQSAPAEAGGNGNYPPPTSGSWYITQPTNVWQEQIELPRSIYVYSSLSMNLVNLTFDCTSDLQYEFYVSSTADSFSQVAARARFTKTKEAQEVTCPPVRGRFVLLRTRSEVNGGPWASVAELAVVGE